MGQTITGIVMAIIGLAVLSVVLSPKARTVQVVGAASNALNSGMATAMSAVTGTSGTGMGAMSYTG